MSDPKQVPFKMTVKFINYLPARLEDLTVYRRALLINDSESLRLDPPTAYENSRRYRMIEHPNRRDKLVKDTIPSSLQRGALNSVSLTRLPTNHFRVTTVPLVSALR
jgi:hypothetical protein